MHALLTPLLLISAATLRTEVAGAVTVSRALIERGRQRRLSSTYGRLRPIGGGSDAGDVALAITDASLCLPCIAKKTGVPEHETEALLMSIATTLKLVAIPGHCDGCLDRGTTFHLNRTTGNGMPGATAAAPVPGMSPGAAVWRYLEEHRGQMFCTQCLGRALGMTRRLDRAVITAEGRGARRRYSACQICRKDRLVCGLP